MSADSMKQGKYRYYTCNSETNKRHARGCQERRIRADDAESVVWTWVHGLMCDEEALEIGLNRLAHSREDDLGPKRERLEVIEKLIDSAKKRIDRLARDYAQIDDDEIAKALKEQLKNVGSERQALAAESEAIRADLTAGEITDADREVIIAAAEGIRERMVDPTFEQKRALFDMLDLQVELVWKNEEERGINCTCGLKLTPEGKRIPMWMNLSRLGGKLSSTTTI